MIVGRQCPEQIQIRVAGTITCWYVCLGSGNRWMAPCAPVKLAIRSQAGLPTDAAGRRLLARKRVRASSGLACSDFRRANARTRTPLREVRGSSRQRCLRAVSRGWRHSSSVPCPSHLQSRPEARVGTRRPGAGRTATAGQRSHP